MTAQLQPLWERGHSNLWSFAEGGIIFHCWSTVTSIQVGGFDASGEIVGEMTSDGTTNEWDVFVPFGETSTLEWHGQWIVTALVTESGVYEVAATWWGGGESCVETWRAEI